MTRVEKRIRDFSLGMKKLGDDSRNYLHKLTYTLFLVEQTPMHPVTEKKIHKQGNKNPGERKRQGEKK